MEVYIVTSRKLPLGFENALKARKPSILSKREPHNAGQRTIVGKSIFGLNPICVCMCV